VLRLFMVTDFKHYIIDQITGEL